ncbi:sterol desaturase family protein [Flavobacterium cellulosilyticum]|uniref:sterol desaturase family protein n=1 Tax=Flavobacterium cellulosilyticum TaxID=2541731 RepID=UPI0038B25FB9
MEYIFVTPSHHRVHHSCNKKYLDKNFGSIFIIWDRLFGTFQAEEEQTFLWHHDTN